VISGTRGVSGLTGGNCTREEHNAYERETIRPRATREPPMSHLGSVSAPQPTTRQELTL
jgi:hypothetical protein